MTHAHRIAPLLIAIAVLAPVRGIVRPAAPAEDIAELFREGQAHESAGQWNQASSVYYKIMEDYPDNALAHYRFGTVQDKLGATDMAMRAYRDAVRLDPNLTDARRALEGHYLVRAREARTKGQRAETLEALRQATEANPASATAHLELGEELQRQGDVDGSLQAYQKAASAEPDDPTAHVRVGEAYARRGMPERAAHEFQEALRINPRNAEAHRGLGVAYGELGQRDKGLASLRQAIRFYVIAGNMEEALAVEELEKKLLAKGPPPAPARR